MWEIIEKKGRRGREVDGDIGPNEVAATATSKSYWGEAGDV